MLLLLAIAINLIAATAPFRLDLPTVVQNRLEERQDGAFVFQEPSMARSSGSPDWVVDAKQTGRLTIDLKLTPATLNQGGPARILALSQGYLAHNLIVGQEQRDLVIRLRRNNAQLDGQPPFVAPEVFENGRSIELLVQLRPGRLQVEVDGKPAIDSPLPDNALSTWNDGYRLALGNEVVGLRGWDGAIERAVVLTPAYRDNLLAPGNLQIPEQWWQVPVRLRVASSDIRPEDVFAAFLHFLAFVPIGYALIGAIAQPGGRLLWPMVLIFALALGIEASKVLIEGRHPTALNLAANFLGGSAGALAALKLRRMRRSA